jgi:RNA polymerase sigma-70 factor (ECF subfamily)
VLVGRESLMEAAAALEAMPARTRAIFLLFRLEHLRQAEIADLYGISVSAVQKHLVRATAALVGRRPKP